MTILRAARTMIRGIREGFYYCEPQSVVRDSLIDGCSAYTGTATATRLYDIGRNIVERYPGQPDKPSIDPQDTMYELYEALERAGFTDELATEDY